MYPFVKDEIGGYKKVKFINEKNVAEIVYEECQNVLLNRINVKINGVDAGINLIQHARVT